MSNPTWDQIGAAIEQAREPAPWNGWDCCLFCGFGREDVGDHLTTCWWAERNAHLDPLAAIHQIHRPYLGTPEWGCADCQTAGRMIPMRFSCRWPCATGQVVIDAITRMGALNG